MKIKSTVTSILYDFDAKGKVDEERYTCPECSAHRKKKSDKCFAWNTKDNIGYCHNCGASFYIFKPGEEKQYIVPDWKNLTELTDKAVKWFTGRMISQKTLNKMRIYSDVTFMPQSGMSEGVMCFPYFFQGELINIKYRGPQKSFKLHGGAELIFYNQDALLNFKDIIIVEGEVDALSFIECGFDNVLSVPNGANVKMEYFDTYHELFDNITKVYIAVDQDTKGIELRDELIRRIGAEKCFIISFKDCKDANEYLVKYGSDFNDLIKDAIPVPVKGIVTIDSIYTDIHDLYIGGVNPGKILNEPFDELIKWETGRLAIVSGIPSSGKSEFVDYIITKLNLLYGWRAGFFTPENFPLKYHYAKIFEKLIGKKFSASVANEMEFEMAIDHIKDNFFYIMNEDDCTVDTVIKTAKILVKTRGIKVLVIDPYNRLEHQFKDSETQYISRFLDKLSTFARMNDVLIFLIAHPRKMDKDNEGKLKVPTLYDINGSSNFYNKCDYGFTVHRKTDNHNILLNEVTIYWQKVKFKYLGNGGATELKYNFVNGRFQKDTNWDNTNWLVKSAEQKIINYTETTWEQRDEAPY
jgi:twinkle protein